MHRIFTHNLDKSLLLNKGLQALLDERIKLDGVNLVVGSNVLLDGREGRTFPVLKSLDGSHNHDSGLGVGGGSLGLGGSLLFGGLGLGGGSGGFSFSHLGAYSLET